MNRYELYIDGQLCDLDEDTQIAFRFQSSMLTELDTLTGNNSWTIHLPFTPSNRRIWGFCERPDIVTLKPYRRHAAALYADGLDIFTAGTVHLLDIDETGYNVFIVWGVIETLKGFFENKMSALSPYLYDMGIGNIAWNSNSIVEPMGGDVCFLPIYFGGKNTNLTTPDDKRYNHPSVSVAALLDAMEQYRPATSDDPDTDDEDAPQAVGAFPEKAELLARLSSGRGRVYMPLTSLNGDAQSGIAEKDAGSLYLERAYFASPMYGDFEIFVGMTNDAVSSGYADEYAYDVKGAEVMYMQFGNAASWLTLPWGADNRYAPTVSVQTSKDSLAQVLKIITLKPIDVGRWAFPENEYAIEIPDNVEKLYFKLSINIPYPAISDIPNTPAAWELHTNTAYKYLFYATPREECRYPTLYPVGANLPDVSIGDFLLSLLTMSGMFAYLDIRGALHFGTWDKFEDNRRAGNVYDWSDRVILNTAREVARPHASKFSTDKWAQRNVLDYDNDDDVTTRTEGVLCIDNRNMDKSNENTVMFSASENIKRAEIFNHVKGEAAYIPIYDDDGKHSDVEPRIVLNRIPLGAADEDITTIFPAELRFGGGSGIVATKYPALQRILNTFRIVTVQMILPWSILRQLDYTRPVFLAGLGRYYAILSIQTGENSRCECKLIQLP